MTRLENRPNEWVPLHKLVDDPHEPNELARARSAIRGLERRGMVSTVKMTDADRQVSTTTIIAGIGDDWQPVYRAEPNYRAWYGLHVRLAGKQDVQMAELSRRMLDELAPFELDHDS